MPCAVYVQLWCSRIWAVSFFKLNWTIWNFKIKQTFIKTFLASQYDIYNPKSHVLIVRVPLTKTVCGPGYKLVMVIKPYNKVNLDIWDKVLFYSDTYILIRWKNVCILIIISINSLKKSAVYGDTEKKMIRKNDWIAYRVDSLLQRTCAVSEQFCWDVQAPDGHSW